MPNPLVALVVIALLIGSDMLFVYIRRNWSALLYHLFRFIAAHERIKLYSIDAMFRTATGKYEPRSWNVTARNEKEAHRKALDVTGIYRMAAANAGNPMELRVLMIGDKQNIRRM